MMKYCAFASLLCTLAPLSAYATKPCADAESLKRMGSLVFRAAVIEVQQQSVPYENCLLENKSKCAQRDVSVITVKPTKIVKGYKTKLPAVLKLTPAFCAHGSARLKKNAMYVFYVPTATDHSPVNYYFVEPALLSAPEGN